MNNLRIASSALLVLGLIGVLSCNTTRYRRSNYLVAGDTVGVVAMSTKVDADSDTALLRQLLDRVGFKLLCGAHLLDQQNTRFGADDQTRAQELNKMVANPSVKAILLYRGGYGAVRTLDYIDWRALKRTPKWIAGYSDVTMLHLAAQKRHIETIHGAMPTAFASDSTSLASLVAALRGELDTIHVPPNPLNQVGKAQGPLIGGNLSILYATGGTPEQKALRKKGNVLFIEDVGEQLYHIDRMLQNLERGGKLSHCKAIIVGYMTGIKGLEPFAVRSAQELIARYTQKYNIPVVFGLPAGHERPNVALYMGRRVHVEVLADKSAVIKFL